MFSSDFSEVNGRYGSGQEVLSGRKISTFFRFLC